MDGLLNLASEEEFHQKRGEMAILGNAKSRYALAIGAMLMRYRLTPKLVKIPVNLKEREHWRLKVDGDWATSSLRLDRVPPVCMQGAEVFAVVSIIEMQERFHGVFNRWSFAHLDCLELEIVPMHSVPLFQTFPADTVDYLKGKSGVLFWDGAYGVKGAYHMWLRDNPDAAMKVACHFANQGRAEGTVFEYPDSDSIPETTTAFALENAWRFGHEKFEAPKFDPSKFAASQRA